MFRKIIYGVARVTTYSLESRHMNNKTAVYQDHVNIALCCHDLVVICAASLERTGMPRFVYSYFHYF